MPVHSLVFPQTTLGLFNIASKWPDTKLDMKSGTNLADQRNRICRDFLKTDCDYLLFVDSDMVFAIENVQRLIDVMESDPEIGVAAAHYTMKLPGEIPSCGWRGPKGWLSHGEKREVAKRAIVQKLIAQVDVVGCGLTIVRRKPLEDEKDYDFFGHYEQTADTEDVRFCEWVRARGWKVVTDFCNMVGHIGFSVWGITPDTMKRYEEELNALQQRES